MGNEDTANHRPQNWTRNNGKAPARSDLPPHFRGIGLYQHGLRQRRKRRPNQHTMLSDSGLELLRQASKGFPRQAGNILHTALRLAVPKGLNHLPDDLLQAAIEALR